MRWVVACLAAVVVLCAGMLAFAGWRALDDSDWHAAVTIDGHAFGRADARNRRAVLEALDAARDQVADGLVQAGLMTEAERTAAVGDASTRDYASAVAASLARDVAVAAEARADGVAQPAAPSAADVFAGQAYAPFGRRVAWLEVRAPLRSPDPSVPSSDWPRPPGGGATDPAVLAARDAVAARAAREAGRDALGDQPRELIALVVQRLRPSAAHRNSSWVLRRSPDSA